MSLEAKNTVTDVIILDDDSDDDVGEGGVLRRSTSMMENSQQVPSKVADTTVASRETLECRSLKASGSSSVPTATPGKLEHARDHPEFLHSNATSHKWAFGAIAELLDNAVDEIQNGATFVKIDKINIGKDNSPALVFQDNGGGMDPDGMRKCMSLDGNGFKTSTMRLGADAIVFSCSTRLGKPTQSVGLMSYTYLEKTGQDDVNVPMIDIDISKELPQPIIYGSLKDWSSNLNLLLKRSPFSTEEQLLQQFDDMGTHGTKVIVYNLRLNDEGAYELIFDDNEDIKLRDENVHDGKPLPLNILKLRSHISYRLRYSLRAYVSMLYLRKFKNFKIILRGIPVKQFNIGDELLYHETIWYKSYVATTEQPGADIKVGFVKEAPKLAVSGFNVYHKNRLIRPFWNVNAEGSRVDCSVVGVLEADFIQPAYDKQDFKRSSLFNRLEARLKMLVADYWKNRDRHCNVLGYDTPQTPVDRSKRKRKRVADQQQTVNTYNPPALPCDKSSQSGFSEASSSRPAPPHFGNSTGLSYNVQPVQLIPQPIITTDTGYNGDDDLVGKSADEIREENIQLFMMCEEYVVKEKELEETVRNLKKELEDYKSKIEEVSMLVDARKRELGLA